MSKKNQMQPNRLTVELGRDPMAGLPYTGDVEKDTATEVGSITECFDENAKAADAKAGYFKAKEAAENNRKRYATQADFWCCFVFQSEEQKMAFLSGLGLDGFGAKYLDGRKVAEKLKVAIPEHAVNFQGEKHDKAMTLNAEPIQVVPLTVNPPERG